MGVCVYTYESKYKKRKEKKEDILLPKLKISHVKFKVYPKNIKWLINLYVFFIKVWNFQIENQLKNSKSIDLYMFGIKVSLIDV